MSSGEVIIIWAATPRLFKQHPLRTLNTTGVTLFRAEGFGSITLIYTL